MSDRVRCLTALLIFPLLAAACGSGRQPSTPALPTATSGPTATATRVPTRTPGPTSTPRPSPTTDPCTPSQVVRTLRDFVPYEQTSVYYNAINEGRSLVVWFVDPDVDPGAVQADVEFHEATAEIDAILLAFLLNHQVFPCLTEEFNTVFVVAVDREYNAWFAAHVVTASLAPVAEPTVGQFGDVELEIAFVRNRAPQLTSHGGEQEATCRWPSVSRGLAGLEDGRSGLEGSYLFSDEEGVHVWIQRRLPDPDSIFFELWELAPQLACLDPAPDSVWVTVVDYRGRLTLFGRVPGGAFRSEAYPGAIMDQFEVAGP